MCGKCEPLSMLGSEGQDEYLPDEVGEWRAEKIMDIHYAHCQNDEPMDQSGVGNARHLL